MNSPMIWAGLFDPYTSISYSLNDTSLEAFRGFLSKASDTYCEILGYIANAGTGGLTCKEIEVYVKANPSTIVKKGSEHETISGALNHLEEDHRMVARHPHHKRDGRYIYFLNPLRRRSKVLSPIRRITVHRVMNLAGVFSEYGNVPLTWEIWKIVFDLLGEKIKTSNALRARVEEILTWKTDLEFDLGKPLMYTRFPCKMVLYED